MPCFIKELEVRNDSLDKQLIEPIEPTLFDPKV